MRRDQSEERTSAVRLHGLADWQCESAGVLGDPSFVTGDANGVHSRWMSSRREGACDTFDATSNTFLGKLFKKVKSFSGHGFSKCEFFHAHHYTKEGKHAIVFHTSEYCSMSEEDYAGCKQGYGEENEWLCDIAKEGRQASALHEHCDCRGSAKHIVVWHSEDNKVCTFADVKSRVLTLKPSIGEDGMILAGGGLYYNHLSPEAGWAQGADINIAADNGGNVPNADPPAGFVAC